MGLICDDRSGLLAVVKRDGHSFVRPVDALEHLVLTEGVAVVGPDLFHDTPILCEDSALAQDVVGLMRAVALVGSLVPAHLADEFNHAMQRLVNFLFLKCKTYLYELKCICLKVWVLTRCSLLVAYSIEIMCVSSGLSVEQFLRNLNLLKGWDKSVISGRPLPLSWGDGVWGREAT